MREMDEFLRQMLIDWALEDLENPIKRQTLDVMSREGWEHHLYKEEQKIVAEIYDEKEVSFVAKQLDIRPVKKEMY